MSDLIADLNLPGDLKKLTVEQLDQVSSEVRNYMVQTVADNGGHLAASLGVVELTVALHSIYNSPDDKIIWDVGHQSYPHKLLTGRWDRFPTLRRREGLCGFPKPAESEHDPFLTGHSSTSISAALGLAQARDLKGDNNKVIAVIGDGAMTGGMAFEALNHAGHIKANVMVVLNDNKMSISSNVGSMSTYLGRIRSDPKYSRLKKDFEVFVSRIPLIGEKLINSAERLKSSLKYLVLPGIIFEELGFTYFGPVDGHNISALQSTFNQANKMKGPVFIHVVTEKGKGYHYAEKSPEKYHGIGPFDLNNGLPKKSKKVPTYTDIFGSTLLELAHKNPDIVALTAAMTTGTGLKKFSETFPDRFYDVGIAEQHGVTLATALAAGGMRPVFAVYSTFLQRAYDQILHDTCMQKLPVIFAVDRAGIVGEDGETHQGLFDLSFLRSMPNMSIMAPANEIELKSMLTAAMNYKDGPVAIRYPRDKGLGLEMSEIKEVEWGRGELVKSGDNLLIIAAGTAVNAALAAAEKLFWQGYKTAVINARFVKPLDEELILKWAEKTEKVITVEENMLTGGFGSAVMELFERKGLKYSLKRIGIGDCFVGHGTRAEMLACYNLDADGIYREAISFVDRISAKGVN